MAAVTCSSCGQSYRIVAEQAGRRVRCPHCRAISTAPSVLPDTPVQQLQASPPQGDAPFDLATAVQAAARSERWPGAVKSSKSWYSPSRLARVMHSVSISLWALAVIVQVYILLFAEWHGISLLPMKVAVPTFVLLFLPASLIALGALHVLAMAHVVEYLARGSVGRRP